VVLRGMRDIAFGAVVADPLVGRSMELHTFDAESAELRIDRFDIRHRTSIEVDGEPRPALAVDVATGLVNERTYYSPDVPRHLMRRHLADSDMVEDVVSFVVLPHGEDSEAATTP